VDHALAYQAAQLGFQVSDAELANTIREVFPQFFPDGKFVGAQIYAAYLAQQGTDVATFESEMKRSMITTRLKDVAVEGTIVTPAEIEQEYRRKNEKIKIEFVKLTADRYKKEIQPSAADMENYYKINAARYQVPESKDLAILVADPAKLEESIPASDADLQRAYNQNINEYRTPERVHARHILLMTQGKPAGDDAKMKAKADDLVKQLRGGADFADLAKKNSEDTGSATKGGDLDWLVRGQTLPEFDKMVFSMKPGQISDPVKTSVGYHIIQLLQHEDARLKPFAEVKADLATQFKKQRVNDLMQNISDKAQPALQKDPLHPEKVAADLNMQLVRVSAWHPGTLVPELGPANEFDQSVSSLKVGEASQPVALQPSNKVVLAVVMGIVPARPQPYADVQNQIRDAIIGNRAAAKVQEDARKLLDSAKASGGNLEQVAKSMGLSVKTSDEFGRNGSVTDIGSSTYLQEGFASPDGTVFGPIAVADGTIVAKVVQHVQVDMSKLADERMQIRDQIKSQKARDREQLFEAGLVDELTRKGVIKYHKPVVDRLIASFRG